jgi:hypothetical protein
MFKIEHLRLKGKCGLYKQERKPRWQGVWLCKEEKKGVEL